MIRLLKKGERVDPQELVGKVVMRDAGLLWDACNAPRLVLSFSKSKLTVRPVSFEFDQSTGICTPVSRERDQEEETMMSTGIRAVCDTPDDAALLMAHFWSARRGFEEFRTSAAVGLAALDGTEAPSAAPSSGRRP